jgi:hypothetical protein
MEIYDKDSKISKELLDESVLQIILDQKVMPGGLCQLPFLKSAMAMECGNHNSQFGLERALNKIHCILNFCKITEDAINTKATNKQIANKYKFIDVIKPEKGFKFKDPNICTEYFLRKDQVYYTYKDSNSKIVEVKAKQDCYVLMPTLYPNLEDTDAGFLAIKLN